MGRKLSSKCGQLFLTQGQRREEPAQLNDAAYAGLLCNNRISVLVIRRIRSVLPLAATALLCPGLLACGGASDAASSNSAATSRRSDEPRIPAAGYAKWDGDPDGDDEGSPFRAGSEDAHPLLAAYPRLPSRSERQTIATTVKDYFAAAAARDGARGCALLARSVAAGFDAGYGPIEKGADGGCAASLDRLFGEEHRQLAAEEPATMTVTDTRLKDEFGMVFLGFRRAPETEILVEREGHGWKIGALFDSVLP
jgi:hypothetical protein